MSGKPWTEERKAAKRDAMRKLWAAGAFAGRRAPAIDDEAERMARVDRMARLNIRMSYDETLKRKCVRGQKRVRRSAAYRTVQAAVMRDVMSRPEQRRRAKFHCIRINKNARTRKRQWASRRRNSAKQGSRS